MSDLIHDASYGVWWVTTLTIGAPTAAQVTAGTRIDAWLTPTGITRGAGNDTIDNSRLNSTFTTMVVGRRTFAPQITVIRDSADVGGVEAALTFKANGFLCVRDNVASSLAALAAQKFDIFPAQIGNAQKSDPAPNQLQTIVYQITMTADAALNIALV